MAIEQTLKRKLRNDSALMRLDPARRIHWMVHRDPYQLGAWIFGFERAVRLKYYVAKEIAWRMPTIRFVPWHTVTSYRYARITTTCNYCFALLRTPLRKCWHDKCKRYHCHRDHFVDTKDKRLLYIARAFASLPPELLRSIALEWFAEIIH